MFDLTLFATIATAIVLEAVPFLLVGALIGALFEVFVSEDAVQRIMPRRGWVQVLFGLCAGLLLPTCECGVVPVARKLLHKGVPPRVVIPYMLSAPVINPVVLVSTYVAFQADLSMVLWRCVLVALPAALLGAALGELGARDVLRSGRSAPVSGCGGHDLEQSVGTIGDLRPGCGPACACGFGHAPQGSKCLAVLTHTSREFLDMGRFLVGGALVAAAFKVSLPMHLVGLLAENVYVAVPVLLLLAVLLSVCSEADAFVAAGFSMFPRAAQLGFVALGPMVDLKLVPMFYATFDRRIATALVVVPSLLVWVLSTVLGILGAA